MRLRRNRKWIQIVKCTHDRHLMSGRKAHGICEEGGNIFHIENRFSTTSDAAFRKQFERTVVDDGKNIKTRAEVRAERKARDEAQKAAKKAEAKQAKEAGKAKDATAKQAAKAKAAETK